MPMHLRKCGWRYNLCRIVVHQHDVRRLDGRIRAIAHHVPISARAQHRRIVVKSPTNASLSLSPFAARSFSTCATLSAGSRSLCTSSAQIFGDLFGTRRVASEHDKSFSTPGMLEPLDGFLRVQLHHVGDDDMARILAVTGHVNDRADAVAVDERNTVPAPSACCCPPARHGRPLWRKCPCR